MIHHNPPLPGLPVHSLPVLNHDRTDHNKKTNGALVHSNSSMNQLLLHDVITLPANKTLSYKEITQFQFIQKSIILIYKDMKWTYEVEASLVIT